jgi:hypothetical protein
VTACSPRTGIERDNPALKGRAAEGLCPPRMALALQRPCTLSLQLRMPVRAGCSALYQQLAVAERERHVSPLSRRERTGWRYAWLVPICKLQGAPDPPVPQPPSGRQAARVRHFTPSCCSCSGLFFVLCSPPPRLAAGKVERGEPDRSVAKIVKNHAARVGLDPALFAGHFLRAGFLTSAAARGA